MNNVRLKPAKERGQLVTFRLGRELYGVDIFKVREVLHYQRVTAIPNAPAFIEGVIRVRDQVVPVVDLRRRLGVTEAYAGKRRIVILELGGRCLGVVVDDIARVLRMDSLAFESLPEAVVCDAAQGCISRIAKTDRELIIELAPERVLTRPELDALPDFTAERDKERGDGPSANGTA